MDIDRIVGRHIELARRERGWNQHDLAQRINVGQQAISRWESGRVSVTADNLWRMCEIFGKSVEYFFEPLPLEDKERLPKVRSPGARARKKRVPTAG